LGAIPILSFLCDVDVFYRGFACLRGDGGANFMACQPSWKLIATPHLNKVTH
jgi:hypothetical protein